MRLCIFIVRAALALLLLPLVAGSFALAAIADNDPSVAASVTPTLSNDWVRIHENMVADATARAKEIQIVLVGDSITARWTTGAGRDLYKERYAPHGAINLGISADGTQHVLWRLQHGVLDPLHPKMVLLMIGTNNMGLEPDAVAYGVWAIVDQIRRTHPETRVLVQAIFPKVQAGHTEKIPVVNQMLAKLDDGKMVKYVDYGSKFLNPDGTLNKDWFPDGVHPEKPEAFRIWADAIQPIVDEWLKAPPVPNVPPPAPPVAQPKDMRSATPDARNDWLYRHKAFASRAARGNCDLLFLGGTVMSLWGRANTLFDNEYKQYRALNGAIWGSRTEHILWQIDNGGIDGLQPRLVVVQVQNNLDDTPAKNVAAGMEAIVKRLREKLPTAKILLVGAFPKGEKPNHPLRAKIAEYNALLATLADGKQVVCLDFGKEFLNPDGTLERGAAPTQEPYTLKALERWAELWRQTITDLMKQ